MLKKKQIFIICFALICVLFFAPINIIEAKELPTSSLPIEKSGGMLLGIGEEETTTATSISLILETNVYPFIFLIYIISFLTGVWVVVKI